MAENKRPKGSASAIDHFNNNGLENNDNWNFSGNGNHRTPSQNENENEGINERRVDFASLSTRKPTTKSKAGGKGKANRILSSPMKPRNVLEGPFHYGAEENTALVLEVDMQRMQLISPPPEETLRRTSRLSGQFTPSSLVESYPPSPPRGSTSASATTKRKRERAQQNIRRTDATEDSFMAADHDQHLQQQQEQTPNPKPRKQGRREHARMASMDSPTRPPASSSYGGENAPTTPTRPRRVLFQSPHAANPDADWIPPAPILSLASSTPATATVRRSLLGARSSRRSVTPIPPYEPPTDVFTPPKEVYMSPPAAKISTRSSKKRSPTTASKKVKGKTNLRVVTTQVKQEIPDDIDLMAPMPPPSPSDDPLLLSGPPEPIVESSPLREPVSRRRSVSVQAETIPEVLPPSSPEPPLDSEEMRAVSAFDFGFAGNASMDLNTEDDSVMQMDPRDADLEPIRLFDFDHFPTGSEGWSDSDDDMDVPPKAKDNGNEAEEEGEGEYTGKWRMTKVRTKLDPPSSATRVRMEEWGRPISPFPKGVKLDLVGEEDEDEGTNTAAVAQEEEEKEEEEVRRMSVEPEEEQAAPAAAIDEEEDQEEEEEREVRQMSIEFEDDEQEQDTSNGEIDISEFTKPVVEDVPPPAREPSPTPTIVDKHASKNAFDFSSIDSPEAGPSNYSMVAVSPSVLQAALADDDASMQDISFAQQEDDGEEGDSSAEDEPGFVKITSADPRAAARAAAILKQHDYECYTKIAMKKQRRASHSAVGDLAKASRRRDVMDAGISKSSGKNRRSTLAMGVIGNQVFIPGTPVMTLPELLQEAEAEVSREIEKSPGRGDMSQVWSARARLEAFGGRNPFNTPKVDRRPKSVVSVVEFPRYADEERAWTKEEWKQLDACFTDQRLCIGATLEGAGEDTLAPVDMISIDDVVDRFVAFIGGLDVIQSYGDAWSRDNLLERTRALQRKQRTGKVAAPTTPRSSSFSFSLSPVAATEESPAALGGGRRIPTMEVPDFTPLGRRAGPPPRRSRAVLPAPVVHEAPFSNLPPEKESQRSSKKIPATLLAPRYSHLLEEAIAISQEGEFRSPAPNQDVEDDGRAESADSSFTSDSQSYDRSQDDGDVSQDNVGDMAQVVQTPAARVAYNPPNSTLGKRVKGFLFSYLPTLSKAPASLPPRKHLATRQPGLPLPPPEVLGRPRGPVTTPARPPLPKIRPPKELVHLYPAPPIQKPALPCPAKPKRLVELHHLSPPPEQPVVSASFVRPRRSSGSSVKDLVKGFEEMRKTEEKANLSLKRVKSIGELNRKTTEQQVRPRWRL